MSAVAASVGRYGTVKRITYKRPWLYDAQSAFLFTPARYSLVEATTKSGKTQGCLIWILEKASLEGFDGWNGWWVAPVHAQARIAYRRMKRMLKKLRQALGSKLVHFNDQEQTVTLPNGAMVWFKSGEKPDNLFGEDVYVAVIDEASRMREEAWHAIRSTLTATRGPVRIIGNVKGRKNWFYNLSRTAEAEMAAGNRRYYYAKLTAWDAVAAGVLAKREIEDARKLLPEAVFNELYLAEATEDGSNPFGIAAIRKCIMQQLAPGPAVARGADLAKSVDYTTKFGLARDHRMCEFDRYQRDWESTAEDLRQWVGDVPTHIDDTGVGNPIVERVQKGRSSVTGYTFTSPSKQRLMQGLALTIAERAAAEDPWIFAGPGNVILNELESFEFVYTRTGVSYSAPVGFHDDCVMGLALADEQFRNLGNMASRGGRVITM